MPLARRHARLALLALGLLLAMLAGSAAAQEPITLVDADPRANAILADAPRHITLTFSAPVDPGRGTLCLVSADGGNVPDATVSWPAPDTAELALPRDLPGGSWLVAWNVAAGDTTGSGFFGFTTGTDRDAAPLTIPDTGFDGAGGTAWLAAGGGGGLLLGACLLVAVLPLRALLGRAAPRFDEVAGTGAVIAGFGALAGLVALASDAPRDGWGNRLLAAVESDDGRLLLAALAMGSLHAVLLALDRSRLAWGTACALPVPLALLTHAADEPAGRMPALTIAWVAIAAVAVVVGGTVALATRPTRATGRYSLAVAIALPTLALAGAWLLWLFGGNRAAIEATDWGQAAMAAVMLLALVAVALIAGLALVRRIGTARALAVPAALGVALALVLGALPTLESARAASARAAVQQTLPLALGDDRAQLILAPAAAGVNHMRLEIDRASLPRGTTAELALSLPARADLGTQTVTLARVDGHAFEYHGAELAVADRWDFEIRLTEPAGEPVTATTALDLADTAPRIAVATQPWRFTAFAGSAGVLLIVAGIAGLAIGVAAGKSPLRLESAGIGVGALLLAAILLGQGRLDPILAGDGSGGGAIDPDDLTAITRGEEVYATSCLSCHGPELRGDGPAAGGMQPPPADFAAPHTRAHDEATLIYWLRHGKQGTTMPAFGGKLSDEEIAAVLSYITRQQREMIATPVP